MRKLRYSLLTLASIFAFITSCKDDSIVIVPEWDSGVHGYTVFTSGSATSFLKGDPSQILNMEMLWNSIDQKNTVSKIEFFALFNESYLDQDGNPKTAKHGGDEGVLFKTLEGSAVPANKATTPFSMSQDDMFALYDGATYDYYGTGTPAPVWGAGSIRSDRNTGNFKFVDGDTFQIRWELTTADGRVFSAWGVSVCTEFPGANCAVNWATVCSQIIAQPAGDYTLKMVDSYGDGWNGAAIKVVVNGVGTNYTAAGTGATTVVTVPGGTTTLTFEWVSGSFDSECTFQIISQKGNIIAKGGPSPKAGVLILDLCKENE